MRSSSTFTNRIVRVIVILFIGLVGFFLLLAIAQQHFYLFRRVEPGEIGVIIRGGQIARIVPPGMYSDLGLFVNLKTYSVEAYQFSVSDVELITSDNQRIGVTVSGSFFRPDFSKSDRIANLWARYQHIYVNDEALQKVANDLAAQAMKVCVGGKPFRESIIGAGRDSLRNCVDEELSKLSDPYGLDVSNVTVPNVTLSPEVQQLLDAITKSRLETEKAEQDRLKAIAQGEASKAEQEAAIRVEQSRAQEEAKQKAVLAQLTRDQLTAEKQVIDAQKTNDLLSAQRDLEINQAMAVAAIEKAKADLAKEIALADLYSKNPNYYAYQIALANASAIKGTDKLIFVPEGTFPQLIFGNDLKPVVPVSATPTPQ
jgi:regulator of protease activity HflC (stomatin/prohibitin superfamily)